MFRHALRSIRTQPWFAAAAIVTMALAIGANAAVFSLVNAVLLRPLPFRDPQSLVWIWSTRTDRDKAFFCLPDYLDFVERTRTLEETVAFTPAGFNLIADGPAERIDGVRATAGMFEMLGVRPALGRLLIPADDAPGSPRVALLSHGFWLRRFGGDGNVVGRALSLNGEPHSVVGVLPPEFLFPGAEAEIITPLMPAAHPRRTARDFHFLRVFARAKAGATLPEIAAEMNAITVRLREAYPVTNSKNTPPTVLPLSDEIVGGYKASLWILLGAVVLVLAIACSNLAGLLLARSAGRRREITIRMALGASRRRIVQQLLAESLPLAMFGGVLGIALSVAGVRALTALLPAAIPRAGEVAVDLPVLLFTAVATLVTGIAFGLSPALEATRVDLNTGLKESSRGSGVRAAGRARRVLVVAQVALSFLLVTTAGLLIRSFSALAAVDPGFSYNNVITVRLSPPSARFAQLDNLRRFNEALLERVRAVPDVEAAAVASILPLSGMNGRSDFYIAGKRPAMQAEYPAAQVRWVTPGYFGVLGIRLRDGREFADLDQERSQPVAVIDETLARRFFPDGHAVGAHLVLEMGSGTPREMEIVGVASAVKHFTLDEQPLVTLYIPLYQMKPNILSCELAVRTRGEPLRAAEAIRSAVQKVDTEVPASAPRTLNQYWSAAIAGRRFNSTLLAIFAAAALLLAAAGLYALLSYSVAQRKREIGIRMAVGAGRASVLGLIVRDGMTLALAGIALGCAGSIAAARWIGTLLFGVRSGDPTTLAAAAVVLIVTAMLALIVPAWRATQVDAMVALRTE